MIKVPLLLVMAGAVVVIAANSWTACDAAPVESAVAAAQPRAFADEHNNGDNDDDLVGAESAQLQIGLGVGGVGLSTGYGGYGGANGGYGGNAGGFNSHGHGGGYGGQGVSSSYSNGQNGQQGYGQQHHY